MFSFSLRSLLQIPQIAEARVAALAEAGTASRLGAGAGDGKSEGLTKDGFLVSDAEAELKQNLEFMEVMGDSDSALYEEEEEDDKEEVDVDEGRYGRPALRNVSFMISRTKVQLVKQFALAARYPLMEEYDYLKDETAASLPMELRPSTKIRSYQSKALAKMFGTKRARWISPPPPLLLTSSPHLSTPLPTSSRFVSPLLNSPPHPFSLPPPDTSSPPLFPFAHLTPSGHSSSLLPTYLLASL